MSAAKEFIKTFSRPLKKVITSIRRFTGYLGPSDDWIEGEKRRLAVALDPVASRFGRNLTFHAHDEDYMYTVAKDSDAVERAIYPSYQRNETSTSKYRYLDSNGDVVPKGDEDSSCVKQWTAGSWVLDPDDTEWQHHVYLFDAGDVGNPQTDIYGHKETSAAKDPYGHVTDPQDHGDPDEKVVPLLASAGINRVETDRI